MLPTLNAPTSRFSRPARAGLVLFAVAALATPLVYLVRSPSVQAEDPSAKEPAVEFLPKLTKAEEKILAALDKEYPFPAYSGCSLQDAADDMKDRVGIDIQLDIHHLQEDLPISVDAVELPEIKGMSFRAYLGLMRKRLPGLAYLIQNEVLLLTSKETSESSESLITRTYPVGDFDGTDGYDELTEAITTNIAPDSWETNGGGKGAVSVVKDARSLVISQTRDTHDQVLELLRSLRAARKAAGPSPKKTTATAAPAHQASKRKAGGGVGGMGGMGGGKSAPKGGGMGGMVGGGMF